MRCSVCASVWPQGQNPGLVPVSQSALQSTARIELQSQPLDWETQAAQTGLELEILLTSPKCWDYRPVPLCLDRLLVFK